uniref:Uncharacterized protein n=1 Tax=Oryza punctata TaxID=4537 RepID=A0A0E0KSW8_ORYPU
MPSFTPGVLGDISNLSAVERRRKWARDKYASMSPEEKKRLLQKNREYRQLKKDGTSTNLAASTTVIDGEVEDNDYQNGDTSQEIVQPPSMSGANVELMEGEAIVHDVDDDDDDDEGYLMRGRARAEESMNSEDNVKVQPSSGQTTNKGSYYTGHANAIRMMFQFIRDGCHRIVTSMEDYKCKKVEEGRGQKRKVGEGYDPRWSSPIEITMKIFNDNSQLITSETRRGIVVATALEVDKASKVRNSLFKEPVLHDAIKIGVTFRKQELLQMTEQNNASGEPEVVIVEDDEVVIEPVPKNKGTANKAFTIPLGVEY